MSRREIRILLIMLLLLFAAACSQFMTHNRLTTLGVMCVIALVALSILAEVAGLLLRREWVAWLGPVFAGLCLLIAITFTFASPKPEAGLFVDTSQAWERYESARRHSE